jgi:hypothetical protein
MSGIESAVAVIASSAICFLVGLLVRPIYLRVRAVRADPFWRPFVAGPSTVVLGSRSSKDLLEYEPSDFVGAGDVQAMQLLTEIFENAGLKRFDIAYSGKLSQKHLETNLIFIGGGNANGIVADVMRHVGSEIDFMSTTEPPALQDNRPATPVLHVTRTDEKGTTIVDYAVIIRARNPDNLERWVVVLAGCTGFGTSAGVALTRGKHLKDAPDGFEIVYQMIIDDAAQVHSNSIWEPRPIAPRVQRH